MPDRSDNLARRKASSRNGVPGASGVVAKKLQKEVVARAVSVKIKKPKFASEAEEADWYPAHPEYVDALFEQAEAEGKLGHGTMARIFGLTKPVTIRLSQTDITKARKQAERRGIGYQTHMKMLLHEALAKAD
jgi:hypothetical protein